MKTLRETRIGNATLRLLATGDRFAGVVINAGKVGNRIDGADPEAIWQQLQREAGRSDPGFIGFGEARDCFLRYFPGGFGSKAYVDLERTYKLTARDKLVEAAPLEAAAEGEGFTEAAIRAFDRTNLVYPVEKTRARAMLRGPKGDAFVRAAARFALEPDGRWLGEMETILRQHDNARWTVATYLPFLWAPERHMYLKPQVTQDFARRVGHRFAQDYDSLLSIDIYESLLDLVAETEREIAALEPSDRIDTQSFIWVIGDYKPGDEQQADVLEMPA